MLQIKRVYEAPESSDGYRVLVDRLWPRGVSKERAQLDLWLKEVGPSKELRQAFHTGALTFASFRSRYLAELQQGTMQEAFLQLQALSRSQATLTLVFAAKNPEENQAVVLQELLTQDK